MGRTLRIVFLAALTVATAACGGGSSGSGSSTPSAALAAGDVAVVGTTHITKTDLNRNITLRVNALKEQKQSVPKAGTTAYTDQVIQPVLQHLVQAAEVRNIAKELNVTATSSDIHKAIQTAIQQNYGGSQEKYQADLKRFGLTEADIETEFTTSILEQKILTKLRGQVKVTDQDVQKYYDQNKASYTTTSDTRVVDYGLYPDKASAQAALTKLKGGGSFKDVSAGTIDSSANHEPFTATKGQLDKNFEKAAFSLKTNELSGLVVVDKTYAKQSLPGKCKPTCYFIIRPTADTVKAGTEQPFDKVKDQIRSQLLSTRQQQHVVDVIKRLEAEQKKATHYATGYAPPKTSSSSPATT